MTEIMEDFQKSARNNADKAIEFPRLKAVADKYQIRKNKENKQRQTDLNTKTIIHFYKVFKYHFENLNEPNRELKFS